jgi:23S rRNA (guanine2535-N1)-methyltransferase
VEVLVSQLGDTCVDVVLTDVPYGQRSQWQIDSLDPTQSPIGAMLNALQSVLHAGSIVAIASDKQQKVRHDGYERVERFQIGKRQVVLLKPRP